MALLVRTTEDRWELREGGTAVEVPPLRELLALPLQEARAVLEEAGRTGAARAVDPDAAVLAPVDAQEVWAAGVTYQRSRDGRAEESDHADVYDLVYDADRPEIFFKATAGRVVGHGGAVGVRVDSGWDVPEPEVGLVLTSRGELFGYVPGDDVSSRTIEGENPLYLPQAKVYDRSCALGPGVVPVWDAPQGPLGLAVTIERGGTVVYEDTTTTAAMARTFEELAAWLFAGLEHPHGVVLLTGTGLVPPADVTLQEGDVVTVVVEGVGRLTNPVVTVGRQPAVRAAWDTSQEAMSAPAST
ncbi:fumarylacetoacetate hydrolase [Streptomyces sp. NP160]|uniref:fumarylacetoacetate hydrolase family protein n=1 Tax=Streptomyces sp. NP160 TaxID=2586637 RepID=UPI001117DEEA|nr:fumarylacetoacetate hydrolase family protein [Streptomyces sp. NP160]TNM69609.1 fumarylacetoacetate hydrolase [Streptomyces sp. NP160]